MKFIFPICKGAFMTRIFVFVTDFFFECALNIFNPASVKNDRILNDISYKKKNEHDNNF